MCRFEIDLAGETALQCRFPSRHTNAPLIAGFHAWKAILGSGSYEIVSIEDRKIEKVLINHDTNCMQPDVFGSGSAVPIAVKSSQWIAAAALQISSENIRRHLGT
jgi:hypothetical protein